MGALMHRPILPPPMADADVKSLPPAPGVPTDDGCEEARHPRVTIPAKRGREIPDAEDTTAVTRALAADRERARRFMRRFL